jgi:hypothetical protein
MSVRSASARFSSVPYDQHGKLFMMVGRTRFGFSRTLILLASGPRRLRGRTTFPLRCLRLPVMRKRFRYLSSR